MAINFPGSLDNFTNPTSASPINSPSHADQHANANDAIEALEAKVGANNSTITTSHDYKIAQLESLVTSSVAGAKSIYQDVRNQSGSEFVKGTPVYVSGSEGASGKMLISAASNASEATSSKTMGITTSAISNNSNGQVISEGIIEGIDTTGAADGDPVWLGVNGAKIYGLVNKPSAPAHLVFLGIVIRGGQANTGSMYVKIQNGFELQEIHNVELSSLVNGNVLAYDSSTSTWKNTNTLQSTSSTVPLVIKRVTSQTSNLQEWRDQSGGMLAFFNKDGALTFNSSSAIGGTLNVFTSYAGNTGVIIRGFTSQTANLQEWQNSAGTVLAKVDANGSGTFTGSASTNAISAYAGASGNYVFQGFNQSNNLTSIIYQSGEIYSASNLYVQGAANYGAAINVKPGSTSTTGMVIRGLASQTADLQQWQDSAGTALAKVSSNGAVRASVFANLTPGLSYIATNFDTSAIGIPTGGAAMKGLVIRGFASQTANLQEWQDSAGTVLANVDASGQITATNGIQYGKIGPAGFQSGGSSGIVDIHYNNGNLTIRGGSAYNSNTSLLVGTGYAGGIGQIIKAVASQTANLQEWQDSSGTVLSSITYFGGARLYDLGIKGSPAGIGWAYFGNDNTSTKNVVVRAFPSQTANLQEWQDSSGTILSKITASGVFGTNVIVNAQGTAPRITLNDASSTVLITAATASTVGTAIKGAASQTADLQQWQNNGGTTLAKISAYGDLIIPDSRVAIGASSVLANTMLFANTAYSNYAPIVVRGAASQTADLTQWQNSAGTVIANITPAGKIAMKHINGISGDMLSLGSNGASDILVVGYNNVSAVTYINGGSYGPIQVQLNSAANGKFVIKGAASQTANLQEWQNSSGTVLSKLDNSGFFYAPRTYTSILLEGGVGVSTGNYVNINPSATKSGAIQVVSRSATNIGFIIQGAASQTANLQEWQDSAGTVLANISPSGSLRVPFIGNTTANLTYIATNYDTNGIGIVVSSAAQKGLIVRGAASQTANLQEWQNSSGTVQAYIGANGFINTNNSLRVAGDNISAYRFQGVSDGNYTMNFPGSGNIQLFSATNDTGSGVGVLGIKNATTAPTSNPTTGGILYVSSGALLYRGTSNESQQIIGSDGSVKFTSPTASIPALIIQGAASPSANLQEWKNSSGTIMARITSSYIFEAYNGVYSYQLGSSNDGSLVANMGANGSITFAGTVSIPTIKSSASSTISVNTATTVDTVALSSFTTIEYTLSIKQGSKIRSSKVLIHTDGISVDSTEYGIMEMGGGITGILVLASVSSTDSILQITIADATTTNATVKLIKTML